ncbi:MAG: hypothetical protein KDE27_13510 [Planctomycetes bacterium]|nr:hypothetical protein [Planctomycetota bacterium]
MLHFVAAESPSTVPFWSAFGATLVCVAGAMVSGLRRRRRFHLVLGPAAMVALTAAIVFTEELVRRYDFPPENLRFHLWFAKTAALLALPVIVTGIGLVWRPRWRRLHLFAVVLWLLSVVVATATGFWMFSTGVLRQ